MPPPSTTSALYPIVISAARVPPHFTTLGAGLLYDSHARETVPTLCALLLSNPPLLENKGKPKSWWRAQCLLYGLNAPEKRTVQELRRALELALMGGELKVPAAIAQLEQKEKGKFRKLNAQVRDATGIIVAAAAAAATPEKKAKALPKNPLKVVRNAGKVTKSQPTKQAVSTSNAVTINLTINNAPAPAQRKTAAAAKKKPPPKPRAKKVVNPAQPCAAADQGYFGLAQYPAYYDSDDNLWG